jgi:hypothetical protein
MKKGTKLVAYKRIQRSFSICRAVCQHNYEKAERKEPGWLFDCLASQVFAAFYIEACMNHIVAKVFKKEDWEKYQWYKPKEKMKLIGDRINHKFDFNKRPYQTFTEIFKFRNSIAHGRTETSEGEKRMKIDYGEEPKLLKGFWDLVSLEIAKTFMVDADEICKEILNISGERPSMIYIPEISQHSITEVKDEKPRNLEP